MRAGSGWGAVVVVVAAAMSTPSLRGAAQAQNDALVAQLGPGFHSGTVEVNGTAIYYVRGGSGPALILLHGFPQDWYEWHKVMPRLADRFTVVAMDLRGVGGSKPTESGYNAANLAKDVHEVAEKLGLHPVYLVGHDIGGMVAYAFLRLYPETLRGVMMLDGPLPGLGPWEEIQTLPLTWHIRFHQAPGLAEALVAGRQAIYFRYFLRGSTFSDEDVAHYAASYADGGHLSSAFEPYRAFPQDAAFNAAQKTKIDVPVVYGNGAGSPFAPYLDSYADALRAHGCTHVETVLIPGAIHYVADEQPERVAELIEKYAARQDTAGALSQ